MFQSLCPHWFMSREIFVLADAEGVTKEFANVSLIRLVSMSVIQMHATY